MKVIYTIIHAYTRSTKLFKSIGHAMDFITIYIHMKNESNYARQDKHELKLIKN